MKRLSSCGPAQQIPPGAVKPTASHSHYGFSMQQSRFCFLAEPSGRPTLPHAPLNYAAAHMRVAIIDYQAGNLTSVQRALHHLGHAAAVSHDPAVIAAADKVVFPGVGAAASCMANLRAGGMDQALRQVIASGKPLLCICVGMQLLFTDSEEDGGVPCLNIFAGHVRRFTPADTTLKVPHMGWNPVRWEQDDPIRRGIADETPFYFVHSYYCAPDPLVPVLASSDHGMRFCAGVRHGPIVAVQFHPEKSGDAGLCLLENFLRT